MEDHPDIDLISNPLDPTHELFEELWEEFITFMKIKKKFDEKKYADTFNLGYDMRLCFSKNK
jgi:hypothetical protein